MEVANGFEDFARAMRRKFTIELAAREPAAPLSRVLAQRP